MAAAPKSTRQPRDLAAAFRVISCGLLGLTRAEIFVAHAILRHISAKDDTCFPSVERLAAMSRVAPRNVIKATNKLCTGPDRLFDKFRKDGRGRTSTANYTPRWSRIRALEAEIEAAFMGYDASDDVPENVTRDASGVTESVTESVTRNAQDHEYNPVNNDASVTSNSDASVTLTHDHLTHGLSPQCQTRERARDVTPEASRVTPELRRSDGEGKPKPKSQPKRNKALEDDGGIRLQVVHSPSPPRRGEKHASERWNADLLRCGVEIAGRVLDWMPEAVAEEATRQERQKYHQGLPVIRDRLEADGQLALAAAVARWCHG